MTDLILECWFPTGIGDFYSGYFSLIVGKSKLESLGFSVSIHVIYNQTLFAEQEIFIKNFDNFFKRPENTEFYFNKELPKEYTLLGLVDSTYKIYYKNTINVSKIILNDLYGYSCETLVTGQHRDRQFTPYPENFFRETSLISERFLSEVERTSISYSPFISIHIRYAEYEIEENEMKDCINLIKTVLNDNPNKNIFLSSNVWGINELDFKENRLKKHYYEFKDGSDRFRRDLFNMCIMSFSEKIYSKKRHWTNFLTYSLLHNHKKLSYDNFIIDV